MGLRDTRVNWEIKSTVKQNVELEVDGDEGDGVHVEDTSEGKCGLGEKEAFIINVGDPVSDELVPEQKDRHLTEGMQVNVKTKCPDEVDKKSIQVGKINNSCRKVKINFQDDRNIGHIQENKEKIRQAKEKTKEVCLSEDSLNKQNKDMVVVNEASPEERANDERESAIN